MIIISLSGNDQTESTAFRKWFGKSKIVQNNKPLVCYHGTLGDFREFQLNHLGKHDHGYLGAGFYFTSLKGIANTYGTKGHGSNVMPVYLNISRPYIIDSSNWQRSDHGYSRVHELSVKLQSVNGNWSASAKKAAMMYRNELERLGYDGIIDNTDGKMSQIVAFYPYQIKSAIGNNGNFSLSDSDITR
jgi:hypothetical protein